jgi:tetratricopeptide (TPR) repeat protein
LRAGNSLQQAGRPAPPAENRPGTWQRTRLVAGAVAGVIVAAGVISFSYKVFESDRDTMSTRQDMVLWANGFISWSPEEWAATEGRVLRSLELTPSDANMWDTLSQLYASRGRKEWTTGQPGSPEYGWYTKALDAQMRSIALRPRNAMAWVQRAICEGAVGRPAEDVYTSWRQALALGPNEPEVHEVLLPYMLQIWDDAPEDMKRRALEIDPNLLKKRDAMAAAERQAAIDEARRAEEEAAKAAAKAVMDSAANWREELNNGR